MAGRVVLARSLARYASISVLLILILFLQTCLALYEDQVGLFDWRQQYVGKVKFAYFDQYSHNSRRAWVATQSNVIAALNARTGSIIWRKVFEEKHGKVDSLLHHANALISISGGGKIIRSWDPNKGHLQWEAVNNAIQQGAEQGSIKGLPGWGAALVGKKSIHSSGGIATLFGNTVHFHSIKDGSELWTWRPDVNDNDSKESLAIHAHGDRLFLLLKRDQIILEIVALDANSGSIKSKTSVAAKWLTSMSPECIFVGKTHLVCSDMKHLNLMMIDLQSPGEEMTAIPLHTLNNDEVPLIASLQVLGDQLEESMFILQLNNKSRKLMKIDEAGKTVALIHSFPSTAYLKSTTSLSNSILVSMTPDGVALRVQVFDLSNFKELTKLNQIIEFDGYHGSPEFASIYLFSKKDNELGYRLLVAFEDHALYLLHQSGSVLWKREEALAGITSVEMIELPAATSASKLELLHEEFATVPNAGILSMFIRRVKVQLKQLEVFTASLKKRKQFDYQSSQQKDETDGLTRDQFGLHKIIVAVTDSGKIFGLDTTKGNVIWSRFLPDFSPYHLKDGERTMIFVQRGTAHFPLPPQCVAVGKKKSGKGTLVYAFNPLTGKPADKHNPDGLLFPYDIMQVSLLPLTDEKFSKAIIMVDDDLKVHIFPETDESIAHFREKIGSLYLHLIDQETNTIKGFMLKDENGNGRGAASVNEAWSVKLPDDQSINKIACKRLDEHVHSVGRVLGDRSVLYKYLNPNLIAFATITEEAQQKPLAFIYVIDGVTGQIVYQARHRNAKGPVQMVLSENWLVYLYYNVKARRTEISVIEMFEGFEERNSTAFSSLDSLDHPLILSQGYLLPVTHVSSAAVTNTERGITHKNLLLSLESGYIYTLPKNMLDPRRTFEHSAELAEEGLMPYVPELPLHPMTYINYNKTVDKIRGIHTASAGLESTSLVLAYGLDLYFTRVTPSRKFDVLKEDFDYIFISGVLSALILGTIISNKLASIRKLNLSWL